MAVRSYDRQPTAADAGGVPDTIAWEFLDGGALQVLGVPAFLGRALSPSDDQPGRDPVVMISHALWKKRYHGDPKVIGRKIYFGSNALTLVGVMPPTFKGVQDGLQFGWLDAWVPLQVRRVIYGRTDPNFFDDRGRRELRVFGRLQPGVSPRQAELRLEALAGVLGKDFPASNAGTRLAVTSEIEARYGPGYGGVKLALAVAMFIAGLVLLIACANVANLLLARGVKRTRELGIRAALGAGRGHILRWLLIESLLLSLAGGALGLLLARWFGAALHLFLPPMPFTPSLDFQADWRTVAWSVVVALLTGLAFGAAPAWNAARADIVRALKTDRGAEGGRFGANRLKQALVIAQLSVSVVVLVSCGLFLRSLQKIKNIDPGYRTDTLLSALVEPQPVHGRHRPAPPVLRATAGPAGGAARRAVGVLVDVHAADQLPGPVQSGRGGREAGAQRPTRRPGRLQRHLRQLLRDHGHPHPAGTELRCGGAPGHARDRDHQRRAGPSPVRRTGGGAEPAVAHRRPADAAAADRGRRPGRPLPESAGAAHPLDLPAAVPALAAGRQRGDAHGADPRQRSTASSIQSPRGCAGTSRRWTRACPSSKCRSATPT